MTGYAKKTTPYLDALANEAMVFEHAYSQSSATMMSVQSMFTGREPSTMMPTPGGPPQNAVDDGAGTGFVP